MSYILINKPAGWTSFDVVAFMRKKMAGVVIPTAVEVRDAPRGESLKPKRKGSLHSSEDSVEMTNTDKQKRIKVGHAGTLDPFATGLLIVGVGREATKKLDEFKNMPKTYVATIKLGATSDTYDKTGKINPTPYPSPYRGGGYGEGHTSSTSIPSPIRGGTEGGVLSPTISEIKKIVKSFKGKQKQIPPMFSAKKINGKKLYELARKGITVERKANEIKIYKIKILDYSWPFLKIEVQCSVGTYIRSLADDIGKKLGTGAYCDELVRTKIGKYSLEDAVTPQSLLTTP